MLCLISRVPYHTEIMEKLNGIDLDCSTVKLPETDSITLWVILQDFTQQLFHMHVTFMIDRGFTYCIPPYMIRSNVVTGVMSFAEMDAMMYKIEGEDLYLIGTSEHSMIGKFIDTMIT